MLWLVLSLSGFCSTDRFNGNVPICVFLFWSKANQIQNLQPKLLETECHIINYLLTISYLKPYCGIHVLTLVIVVRTSLRSFCTAMTSGQYFPVYPGENLCRIFEDPQGSLKIIKDLQKIFNDEDLWRILKGSFKDPTKIL